MLYGQSGAASAQYKSLTFPLSECIPIPLDKTNLYFPVFIPGIKEPLWVDDRFNLDIIKEENEIKKQPP